MKVDNDIRLTRAQREALAKERFIIGGVGDVVAPAGALNAYVKVRRVTFDKLKALGLVEQASSTAGATHYGLTERGRIVLAAQGAGS